ncbi:MAG TPA: MFS transporter [Nocardioidaceae bacterium]|nr:MFS transporter [Nocardioidaceae bacterium]
MRAAFTSRGFPRLFAGLFASMIGDSLMLIVLGIWVKELTGSNGAAGLVFFFMALPSLFSPLAGMFVDRVKRRTMLVWGNLATAAGLVPLLFVHDRGQVWVIYCVAVWYGISWTVLPAALNGLLKELLAEQVLVEANASLSTSKEGLRLFGPLLGAGLYTWLGGGTVALIDMASFAFAALAVATLALRERTPEREEEHWRAEFVAGIRHIRHDRVLLQCLLAVAGALLVVGFMESAVFAAVAAYGQPASFVGVVVSVQGLGAVAGGLCSSYLIKRIGEISAIAGSLLIFAVGLAVAAGTPVLGGFFAGTIILGFALPVFIVALTTLLQTRTPHRLMGRVSAATDTLLGTPQAGSIALGALLVTVLTFRSIFWLAAAVIAVSAGYLMATLRGELRPAAVGAGLDVEPQEAPAGVTAAVVPELPGVGADVTTAVRSDPPGGPPLSR